MENSLSNIFKDLKGRISSPFFFSFLLSWLVFNWQIIIALLFYKHNEVLLDGYSSYINLIKENSYHGNSFWYPLLAALSYTLIYPIIKNGFDAFRTWVKTWGRFMDL